MNWTFDIVIRPSRRRPPSPRRHRWSSVSRSERYKKRSGGELVDDDNPLPDFMDPITLEPVVAPAISPSGHVMGSATWKVRRAHDAQCRAARADGRD